MSAMIHGANYGFVLGILACLLFTILSPLLLILSAAGIVYSFRALGRLVFSLVSVGLDYRHLTAGFPAGLIPSDVLPGFF